MSYTQAQLVQVYQEIALERPHRCNACGRRDRLSHSHLVRKGRASNLVLEKRNIVYHCLDGPEGPGCHSKFEGILAPTLPDFEGNFRIIHELDKEHFYSRMFRLLEYYLNNGDMVTLRRIQKLMDEFKR